MYDWNNNQCVLRVTGISTCTHRKGKNPWESSNDLSIKLSDVTIHEGLRHKTIKLTQSHNNYIRHQNTHTLDYLQLSNVGTY